MLISEAFYRRKFHRTEIQRLEQRINDSLITQENSDPAEDPKELIAKLVAEFESVTELTKKIYRTNHTVKCGEVSLAEARIRLAKLKDQSSYYERLLKDIPSRLLEAPTPKAQKMMYELLAKTREVKKNSKSTLKLEKTTEFYDNICKLSQIKDRADTLSEETKALEAQILELQSSTHLIEMETAQKTNL